ncbi:Uncharacterized protein BM_BM8162 [Brugia malayi]|uniref:Bm12932 n=1 Tax=Brugia malayi TaxID=6279 RepID=A0A1P6CD23_BRUMA|nr:Uncharacterized protein BM_BM8162 [Brugia malayi]CDP91160.1 Bm8162 [Brugia malayi]CDQ02635.1 Bm12932 [Brugia malayi]VIO96637.1 Uncharacterized protein BM_BM8162 [Brugia malayi]
MELQGNSQTQSSKILSTTRGSCHARHVSLLCSEAYSAELRELTEIRSPCDSYSHKWGLLQGWSGSRPAERFFGAFFAIRLIGRSCREEGQCSASPLGSASDSETSFRLRNAQMLPISLWPLE